MNIKHYGYYAITYNGTTRARLINEIIRIHDAIEVEKLYCKRKIKEQAELVDTEIRNCFQIGQVTSSILKCTNSFNHYRMRDKEINNGLIDSNCLRCSKDKTWKHIVQCP